MHHQVKIFLEIIESFIPKEEVKSILDVGSLDINGNNRWMFSDKDSYFGVDIVDGKNVDYTGTIVDYHKTLHCNNYDVVISTEMFEHDKSWKDSIMAMLAMCRSGGYVIFTCATVGRREHGTTRTTPKDSPATNDYYMNLTRKDFEKLEGFKEAFSSYYFFTNNLTKDLYFYGRKH